MSCGGGRIGAGVGVQETKEKSQEKSVSLFLSTELFVTVDGVGKVLFHLDLLYCCRV